MASDPPDDDFQAALFALQLKVARRADELAQSQSAPAGLQLQCWLLAEEELLHKSEKRGVSPPN